MEGSLPRLKTEAKCSGQIRVSDADVAKVCFDNLLKLKVITT